MSTIEDTIKTMVADEVARQLPALIEKALGHQPSPDNGETWLTAQELSRIIGKSPNSIYRDARAKVIPSRKFGGLVRFPLSQFERI